jgi:hypothetical protein
VSYKDRESLPSKTGVTSSSQTRSIAEEEAHLKTRKSLERTKIWSWIPKGPETKNDCAGEDQEQFTMLDWS